MQQFQKAEQCIIPGMMGKQGIYKYWNSSDDISYKVQINNKQVNDFMFSNNEAAITNYILILTLAIVAIACQQDPLVFHSKATNCTLTFGSNNQTNAATHMELLSCTRHLCIRNLIDGHCANLQQFKFDQQKCYWECCGSDVFDFVQCQSYNERRLILQQSMDQKLQIALIASSIGLLVAVVIFAIFYLRCCSKQQIVIDKSKENQFYWKSCHFSQEKKCQICKQTCAFIMLPCGKFYHLKCMSSFQKWECNHCNKGIKKVKVFCPVCLKKCIIVQGQGYQGMDKKISQMYQVHPYRCMQQMSIEMDTDRKFSQSTKQ